MIGNERDQLGRDFYDEHLRGAFDRTRKAKVKATREDMKTWAEIMRGNVPASERDPTWDNGKDESKPT